MVLKKLKKFRKAKFLLLLSFFIMPFPALAYSNYLIPGGENIGIQIQSKGIIIVGTYETNGTNSADASGLKAGDRIFKINGKNVATIDEMASEISRIGSTSIEVSYLRDGKQKTTSLTIFKDENGVYKTGLYVKDSITGIGTLSFIDPETKIFGALGHEILERSTGQMLEVKEGRIFDTNVTTIDRSERGTPGSKNAELEYDDVKGNIKENTKSGIFGTYTEELPNKKTYKVASPSEVKTGEAKLLTVVKNKEVKEYSINILKVSQNDPENKNILFEITDEELLNTTGGVVQGMSGSSIIQGDYIVGAVTHVVIDNPKRGFGILITKMLEEAEN